MIPKVSRSLTYLTSIFYAILGAWLFFLPEQLAPVFAWKVTPFMTMTIGGWCLGNAWLAFFAARRWMWSRVYTSLYYLWLFGIGQSVVLYAFRDKLVLKHPVAWLYLLTLLVNLIAGMIGVIYTLQKRTVREASEKRTSTIQFAGVVLFVIFVGFLGLYGCTAQIGDVGTNGGIFPEIMSLFTLRSFGAFYLTIALGTAPLLWDRRRETFLSHGLLSYGLILFITTAAFMYIRLFDFSAKPGGLAYFGAYIATGIVFLVNFRKYGTGA